MMDGQPAEGQLPHAWPHNNAHRNEQPRQILRRKSTKYLSRSQQCHPNQRRSPRAKQSDNPRIDQRQKRYVGRKRTADERERGSGGKTLLQQGSLNDTPAIYRANEPESNHTAAENNGPAVATIWDGGVGDL